MHGLRLGHDSILTCSVGRPLSETHIMCGCTTTPRSVSRHTMDDGQCHLPSRCMSWRHQLTWQIVQHKEEPCVASPPHAMGDAQWHLPRRQGGGQRQGHRRGHVAPSPACRAAPVVERLARGLAALGWPGWHEPLVRAGRSQSQCKSRLGNTLGPNVMRRQF